MIVRLSLLELVNIPVSKITSIRASVEKQKSIAYFENIIGVVRLNIVSRRLGGR